MAKSQGARNAIRNKTSGNCYYCGLPMMKNTTNNPKAKTEWLERHGFSVSDLGAKDFCKSTRETIEHLTRKADGGTNANSNLVFAHQFCNSHRGTAHPKDHKDHMKKQIENPLTPLFIIKNYYKTKE